MTEGLEHHPRQLAAIWFADIVGFSTQASSNEDAALRSAALFHQISREIIEKDGGRVVKFMGDAVLAEFASTGKAAESALELVKQMREEHGVALRVGLHVGEVARSADGDILGDGTNLAARIQTAARPGQILVSESAWRQLKQRSGFSGYSIGRRKLKGQREAMVLWAVEGATSGEVGRLESVRRGADRLWGSSRSRIAVLLGVLILASGAAAWFGRGRIAELRGPRPQLTTFPMTAGAVDLPDFHPARIAVLYFDDHSPDGSLGYLADGLTEGLIHELSQVPALEVISRNGVRPYRDELVSLDSIVQVLKVGSVVEGSVARRGDDFRVTVQLVDAQSEAYLASRTFNISGNRLFALEDTVVQEVAAELRQTLGREIRIERRARGTQDAVAWEIYLRARELFEEVGDLQAMDPTAARNHLVRADSLLRLAESRDPKWSEPTVARAGISWRLSRIDSELPGFADSARNAEGLAHVARAISRQPNDPAAYELRSLLLLDQQKLKSGESKTALLGQAEVEVRRALALDPQRSYGWRVLSEILVTQGRHAEANLAVQRALSVDAFLEGTSNIVYQIYSGALEQGPGDDAAEACREGRRRFPRDSRFVVCELFLLASFPQVEPDVNTAAQLSDLLPTLVTPDQRQAFQSYGRLLLAEVYARAGEPDEAVNLIRQVVGDSTIPWLAYNEAHAWMLMDERHVAVEKLAVYLTFDPDTAYIRGDWWFQPLHGYAPFETLLGN